MQMRWEAFYLYIAVSMCVKEKISLKKLIEMTMVLDA